MSNAARLIDKHILLALMKAAMRSGFMKYLEPSGQIPNPPFSLGLRDGQAVFLKVTISRMLMMTRLRKCKTHRSVWHKHGDRDFYKEPAHGVNGYGTNAE